MGLEHIGLIGSPKAQQEEAQAAYKELLKDMLTPDCKVQLRYDGEIFYE